MRMKSVFALCIGIWLACAAANAETEDSSILVELKAYLSASAEVRPPIGAQAFATKSLSREGAKAAAELLVADWRARIRRERAAEMAAKEIKIGERAMPIWWAVYGEKPAGGRSLYISMHGGGNAPARTNDQQWNNQKRLYHPKEGVYVAPRAPTNTWNLWHEAHIDALFDRLIENLIVFEDVDPNRVYIMGYSAGGDGVYQLAPRMADRLAAAAMMAGHPNEASPLGLRNIAFAIHVGELDGGYNRNKVAAEWKEKLAALAKVDAGGYRHLVEIHAGKPHWMDREDSSAVEWMHEFVREPFSKRVVWRQDDVTHSRFYWLAVDEANKKGGAEVRADLAGQAITIQTNDVKQITVRVNDAMLDMDEPVTIRAGEKLLFSGKIERTIAVLSKTLAERGDPKSLFAGEVEVQLQQ